MPLRGSRNAVCMTGCPVPAKATPGIFSGASEALVEGEPGRDPLIEPMRAGLGIQAKCRFPRLFTSNRRQTRSNSCVTTSSDPSKSPTKELSSACRRSSRYWISFSAHRL